MDNELPFLLKIYNYNTNKNMITSQGNNIYQFMIKHKFVY